MRRARLTDDRRLQDMIDATPCAVIDFAIAHGRRMKESEAVGTAEDTFKDGYDFGRAEGYATGWRARASGRATEPNRTEPNRTENRASLSVT